MPGIAAAIHNDVGFHGTLQRELDHRVPCLPSRSVSSTADGSVNVREAIRLHVARSLSGPLRAVGICGIEARKIRHYDERAGQEIPSSKNIPMKARGTPQNWWRFEITTPGIGNPNSTRERMSKILKWLSPAALVLGAGLLAGPASAAPVSSLAGLTEAQTSNVEQVHYRRARRCWRHRGHWHCRRPLRRYGYYAYPYYEPYPYYYGYGQP